MSVVFGEGFLYGVNAGKPTLPVSWKYIEGESLWLLAESPDGKRYFVQSDGMLTRCNEENRKLLADLTQRIQL